MRDLTTIGVILRCKKMWIYFWIFALKIYCFCKTVWVSKKTAKTTCLWKNSRNCISMLFCRISLDFGVKIQSSNENHINANFNNSATSSLNFSVIFRKLAISFLLRSLIKSLQHFLWPCITAFWGVIHLIIDSRNGCDCSYKSY